MTCSCCAPHSSTYLQAPLLSHAALVTQLSQRSSRSGALATQL